MGGNNSKTIDQANGHSKDMADSEAVFDLPTELHSEPIQSLCVGAEGELFSGGVDRDVILYSWTRHTKRARFKGPSKDITKVLYTHHNARIYAACRDRVVYSWAWPVESSSDKPPGEVDNLLLPEPVTTLHGHSLGVTSLAASEGHPQLLCSGSRDNSVCLWDTNTKKSISSMYASRNLVTGLEWVEGEKAVLQSSEDKTLRVWDLASCSIVQQFRARNDLQTCCAVSSNKQQFVGGSSGSGLLGAELTLWDRRNERKPVLEFKGHSEGTKDCLFVTVDGKEMLVSAGVDSTLRLWNKETGACVHTEYLTDAGPLTAVVEPSPGLIACSSFKNGVSIWTVNTPSKEEASLSIRAKY